MQEAIGHAVIEVRRGDGLATLTLWTDDEHEMTIAVLPKVLEALSVGLGDLAAQHAAYRAFAVDIFTPPEIPDDEPEPGDGGLSLID